MVTKYGMSDTLGPIVYGLSMQVTKYSGDFIIRNYSEETAFN